MKCKSLVLTCTGHCTCAQAEEQHQQVLSNTQSWGCQSTAGKPWTRWCYQELGLCGTSEVLPRCIHKTKPRKPKLCWLHRFCFPLQTRGTGKLGMAAGCWESFTQRVSHCLHVSCVCVALQDDSGYPKECPALQGVPSYSWIRSIISAPGDLHGPVRVFMDRHGSKCPVC